MTTQIAERQIVAFLDGEDSLEIANIIHLHRRGRAVRLRGARWSVG